MPSARVAGVTDGEPRCEGKGGPLLERAMTRSMRLGGSASVVDPLLSLLADLHRLAEQVRDTLSLLGVDVEALPVPYQQPRYDRHAAHAQAQSAPCASHGSSSPGEAPVLPSSTDALPRASAAPPAPNPLATYCALATALAQRTDDSPRAAAVTSSPCGPDVQAGMVEGVLHWLDDHFALPSTAEAAASVSSSSSTTPGSSVAVADHSRARRLLANWVACSVNGSGTPVLVQSHDTVDDAIDDAEHASSAVNAHRKRRRRESVVACTHAFPEKTPIAAPDGKVCAGVRSQGVFTPSELGSVVQLWAHYRRGLFIASREAGALLHALCSPRLGASLSTHSKWIETTAKDRKRPFHLPSCAGLTRNYEEILHCHDCFASCQRPVRAAFVALEACVETLCEEALVVGKRDAQFWAHARCFQAEYAALHTIRTQVARIIASVSPCLEAPR